MAGNRACENPAYDFRTRDTYIPEAYSAGCAAARKPSAKKSGSGLSPCLAAVGIILTAAMICGSLLLQVRLSELSNRSVETQKQIELLKNRQARLEIVHAQTFEPEKLESYAVEVLGMQAPGADQIIYIDSSDADLPGG